MEQIISGDPEDLRESLVIFRHELGLRRLLADAHDLVDVLHRPKAFRPQLLGARGFELGKARREMELDALLRPALPALCVRASTALPPMLTKTLSQNGYRGRDER